MPSPARLLLGAATSLLVGGPDGTPVRVLNANLRPAGTALVLPARTRQTALSPSGRRVAALAARRIVLFDRRTGRRVHAFPARGATQLLWTARRRMLILGFDSSGNELLRSVAVPSGRAGRRVALQQPLEVTTAGARVRVIERTARGLRVDTYDARARRRARFRVPLPAGIEPGFAQASLAGNLLLVSYTADAVAPYDHTLVPLGGRAHAVTLPGAVYSFVTPGIVADGIGHLARIDRKRLRVVRRATIAEAQRLTPYRGGVVVGLARAVYDSELRLMAEHPSTPAPASQPVARRGRVFALTLRCGTYGPAQGAVAVDISSGAVRARRSGPFALGPLGDALARPPEDGCD